MFGFLQTQTLGIDGCTVKGFAKFPPLLTKQTLETSQEYDISNRPFTQQLAASPSCPP